MALRIHAPQSDACCALCICLLRIRQVISAACSRHLHSLSFVCRSTEVATIVDHCRAIAPFAQVILDGDGAELHLPGASTTAQEDSNGVQVGMGFLDGAAAEQQWQGANQPPDEWQDVGMMTGSA